MQIYIWNALICMCIVGAVCFWFGYSIGNEKGVEHEYTESRKQWVKTYDKLLKDFEKQMSIYKKVMLDEKNRYHELCEKVATDDPDGEVSGLLTYEEDM